MSTQQLDKIQALEKQLESLKGHPGSINTKQTPVFIQIPDTTTNYVTTNTMSPPTLSHWFPDSDPSPNLKCFVLPPG